jgi:hypothetical protein
MSAENDKQEHHEHGTLHKLGSAALRGSTEAWAGLVVGTAAVAVVGLTTKNVTAAKAAFWGTVGLAALHGTVTGWQDLEEDNKLIRENATLKKENKNWVERIEVMQEKAQQAGVKI